NVGYAHVDGPYAGWAAVAGLYGVAFLAAFAASALAALAAPAPAPRGGPAAAGVAVAAALAGIAVSHITWSRPHGQPLEVRLVQRESDPDEKVSGAGGCAGMVRHMTQEVVRPVQGAATPKIIMLPKTVMRAFQDRIEPAVWQARIDLAARDGATILMG